MRGHLSLFNRSRSRFYAGPAGQPDFAFAVHYRKKAEQGGSDEVVLSLVEGGLASVHHVVATGRCPHPRFSHRVLSRPRSTPPAPASTIRPPQLPRSRHGRLPTQIRASRAPSRITLRRSPTHPLRLKDFPVSTTANANRFLKPAEHPLPLGTVIDTGAQYPRSKGAASRAALPKADQTTNKTTTKTTREPTKASPRHMPVLHRNTTKTKPFYRRALALGPAGLRTLLISWTLLSGSPLSALADHHCATLITATHRCPPLPATTSSSLWDPRSRGKQTSAFAVPTFHLVFPTRPAYDTFSKQPP